MTTWLKDILTALATWWLASEYGKATARAAAADQEADYAKQAAADNARMDGVLGAGGTDAERLRQRSRRKA